MYRDYHYAVEVNILLANPKNFTHSINILHMVAGAARFIFTAPIQQLTEMHLQTVSNRHLHSMCIIVTILSKFSFITILNLPCSCKSKFNKSEFLHISSHTLQIRQQSLT